MSKLVKIRKTKDERGMEIQHALYDTGHSFLFHRWEEATDTNRVVEKIEYEGFADRRAVRAMAYGCLDSLHHQAMHETRGEQWTDKRGIVWRWADSMGRYVTIPKDDE